MGLIGIDPKHSVQRVVLRAGKAYLLKDNIRTIEDIENQKDPVLKAALMAKKANIEQSYTPSFLL